MKLEDAKRISPRIISVYKELHAILNDIEEHTDEPEFKRYRHNFAVVMGEIALEIMEPLFKEHPQVMPPEYKR